MTVDYFNNLFSSSNTTSGDLSAVLECTDTVIEDQMNESLCEPFTAEEIRRAVFDMHPSKAPGLDGFTAYFIKNFGQ